MTRHNLDNQLVRKETSSSFYKHGCRWQRVLQCSHTTNTKFLEGNWPVLKEVLSTDAVGSGFFVTRLGRDRLKSLPYVSSPRTTPTFVFDVKKVPIRRPIDRGQCILLFLTLRRPLKPIHFDQKKFIYWYIFKRLGVCIQIGSCEKS